MTRVLSGAVLILCTVGLVWLAPAPVLLVAAVLVAVGGAVECAKLAGGGASPLVSALVAALSIVAVAGRQFLAFDLTVLLMSGVLAVGALTVARWKGGEHALASAAVSLFPALYLGLPLGALVLIHVERGPAAVFLLLLTVVVSDTAQYYTGRAFGRRRLAPAISPGKTIEGAVGGFVFGTLFLVVAGAWWLPEASLWLRISTGLAVVTLGIMGDLFESVLKRSAGVKDSSALIPGHGGVLDRIDALLFATPVYYVFIALL